MISTSKSNSWGHNPVLFGGSKLHPQSSTTDIKTTSGNSTDGFKQANPNLDIHKPDPDALKASPLKFIKNIISGLFNKIKSWIDSIFNLQAKRDERHYNKVAKLYLKLAKVSTSAKDKKDFLSYAAEYHLKIALSSSDKLKKALAYKQVALLNKEIGYEPAVIDGYIEDSIKNYNEAGNELVQKIKDYSPKNPMRYIYGLFNLLLGDKQTQYKERLKQFNNDTFGIIKTADELHSSDHFGTQHRQIYCHKV